MKTFALAVACAAFLSACVQAPLYRDPISGNVMQCNSTAGGAMPIRQQREIDACSEKMEQLGWKKL